jgi:hypothetical protein
MCILVGEDNFPVFLGFVFFSVKKFPAQADNKRINIIGIAEV